MQTPANRNSNPRKPGIHSRHTIVTKDISEKRIPRQTDASTQTNTETQTITDTDTDERKEKMRNRETGDLEKHRTDTRHPGKSKYATIQTRRNEYIQSWPAEQPGPTVCMHRTTFVLVTMAMTMVRKTRRSSGHKRDFASKGQGDCICICIYIL